MTIKPFFFHLFFHRLHDEAKQLKSGQKRWPSALFIVVGLLSLLWLAIRSAPKPSRLNYPCQRAAATNSLILFGWIGSVLVATLFSKRLRGTGRLVYRLVVLAGVVTLALGGLGAFVAREWQRQFVARAVGEGISRVVWVQDSDAGLGWDEDVSKRVDPDVADAMMDLAIMRLTGQGTVAAAWSQVFQDHNGGADYQPGEIIAIKINFNNSRIENLHNPNYQIVNAVLRQLVDEVGVDQSDIILYDASRDFQPRFSDGVAARFPNVQLNPDTCWDVSIWGTRLTCHLRDATYLINMPLLRNHYAAGATFSLKNHLGSLETPSDMHAAMLEPEAADNSLVALNNLPNIRDKTLLVVADAIYGLKSGGPDGYPDTSDGITDPLPNSIFLSTDPVAADSVMADYLENRGADFDYRNPRVYLAAAASIGLGNYETSLSYDYSLIDLVQCVDGICSGGVNHPPDAADDAYTTPYEKVLTVKKPGLLGNDTDPDGNPLNAALASGPDYGSVNVMPNGSFTYTPAAGFNGLATFTYTASDGSDFDTAAVTITVEAEIPAAPTLIAPLHRSALNNPAPLFEWELVSGSIGYAIQIDNNSTFDSPEQAATPGSASYPAAPLAEGAYFWRVRAFNVDGKASPWSAVWKFTIDLHAPEPPRLRHPGDAAHTPDTTPDFRWTGVHGASQYRLQLAVTSDLAAPLLDATTTREHYTAPDALPYGIYYWWAQAGDAAGNWGNWSAVSSFTLTPLKSPHNGSSTTNTTPVLRWTKVKGATSYQVQMAADAAFNTLVIDEAVTVPHYQPPAPLAYGLYYWRVRVDTGVWSPAWTVTITPKPPKKPTLTAPANHTFTNVSTVIWLWEAVADGITYRLQVDDTKGFTSPVLDITLDPTVVTYSQLLAEGRYYWHVRAINSVDVSGPWSTRWAFTIATTPPEAPLLKKPVDGATLTNTRPKLTWESAAEASHYELQLDPDPAFPLPPVSVGGKTHYRPPETLPVGIYYWRVRAIDQAGNVSAWSAAASFSVVSEEAAPPVLTIEP